MRTSCEDPGELVHKRSGGEGRGERPLLRLLNKSDCSIKSWNQMPDARQSSSREPSIFGGAQGGTGSL